jgi:hypothetical protein
MNFTVDNKTKENNENIEQSNQSDYNKSSDEEVESKAPRDLDYDNDDIFKYDSCVKNGTIKSSSPFTKYFEDITVTVRRGLEDHQVEAQTLEKNPFYFPELFNFPEFIFPFYFRCYRSKTKRKNK